MIATSTVVMFGLMYLNTYLFGHVYFSETRAYMALVMGATMAIIMLSFMLSMYSNTAVNAAIFAGAVIVFAGALWLVRSQTTVGDLSFMRAMIPHHSIAIMTSNRSSLSDPRAQKLADEIIYAQNKEIAEMRYLIDDIAANGDANGTWEKPSASLASLDEALATPEVGVLDTEPMTPDDIAALFPAGAGCTFSFTTESPPVLAVGDADGGRAALIRISGDLVRLDAQDPGRFAAEGIEVRISDPISRPVDLPAARGDANMTLELDAGLSAGYRGHYRCRD
jgi:hypothetical protein